MEFSEKLQKIRKEHNITQEVLADKLNVSRQAVSKWESGVAYPDTEKLIQISKIFNVSLDELINDTVDIEKSKNNKDKKILFMDIFNNGLDFISKSINMFWSMKFFEKIKCLFEMAVLIFIICIVGIVSSSIVVNIFRRIFIFLPSDITYFLCSILDSILLLIWIVLGVIIVFRIFKSRYLDYYVFVSDNSIDTKKIEEPIRELKEKKEYRVVIRDPKDSSLNIFKGLGKVFMLFIKFLFILVAIPVVILFILGMVGLIYSIFYILSGLFFKGIVLAISGVLLFLYLVIEFIFNIIFNRSHKVNRMFIIFISSITLVGVGFGLSLVGISNFEYKDVSENEVNKHTIKMEDNLVLHDLVYSNYSNVIIDNSLEDIKIEVKSYGWEDAYLYTYNTIGNNNSYKVVEIVNEYNEFMIYKDIINNIKDGYIVDYNDYGYNVLIYMSSDNFTKIKENNNNYIEDIW